MPQGSPISPLLLLLYMAEPMRNGNCRALSSYTDDIGILGIGRSLAESAMAAQGEVDDLLKWAEENTVSFDLDKSEVIKFKGRNQGESVGI